MLVDLGLALALYTYCIKYLLWESLLYIYFFMKKYSYNLHDGIRETCFNAHNINCLELYLMVKIFRLN
jgi:hypothetical protein